MLNQAELNFYGYNTKNILFRENRGKISVEMFYDAQYRKYVVTRRTPKTYKRERFDDCETAKSYAIKILYTKTADIFGRC